MTRSAGRIFRLRNPLARAIGNL